jgi:hypothetical protein
MNNFYLSKSLLTVAVICGGLATASMLCIAKNRNAVYASRIADATALELTGGDLFLFGFLTAEFPGSCADDPLCDSTAQANCGQLSNQQCIDVAGSIIRKKEGLSPGKTCGTTAVQGVMGCVSTNAWGPCATVSGCFVDGEGNCREDLNFQSFGPLAPLFCTEI